MEMNKIMKDYLEKLDLNSNIKNINELFSKEFINLLFPNFKIVQECIFINIKNIRYDKTYIIKTFGSLSAFEDYNNHIHIEDICKVSIKEQIKIMITVINNWKIILSKEFPNQKFCIALFCDFKKKINTIVRISKIREYEEQLYSNDYIEKNKAIGILVEKIG